MEQRGKQTVYIPLIEKSEYDKNVINSMLREKLKIPSLEKLIAAFCGKADLSDTQKKRLNQLINDFREEGD